MLSRANTKLVRKPQSKYEKKDTAAKNMKTKTGRETRERERESEEEREREGRGRGE